MSKNKHFKALRTVFFVGLFCSIPLGFLYHLTSNTQLDDFFLDLDITPFIWKIDHIANDNPKYNSYLNSQQQSFYRQKNTYLDSRTNSSNNFSVNQDYLTQQSFLGNVTVLIYLDSKCSNTKKQFTFHNNSHYNNKQSTINLTNPCLLTIAKLISFSQSLDHKFTLREHFDETQISLKRILITDNPSNKSLISQFSHNDQRYYASNYIIIKNSPQIIKDLDSMLVNNINSSQLTKNLKSFVMIIDRKAKIKGLINSNYIESKLSNNSTMFSSPMLSVVSKIYFYSSMNEYLSTRTFFGEKKQK